MLLTIAASLNVLSLGLLALILWVGKDNHKAPAIVPSKSPFSNDTVDALQNNFLFRLVDKIPLIRRSGNATVVDLAKAMLIVLLLTALPGLLTSGLPLWCLLSVSAFFIILVDGILFLHPALSHRQRFGDNLRGKSPFARKSLK